MKIKTNTSKNKKVLLIFIGVAAALAIYTGIASAFRLPPFSPEKDESSVQEKEEKVNDVDYTSPTDEQVKSGQAAKEDFLNRQEDTKNESISISNISQQAKLLSVRTIIDTIPANGAKCTMTLSREGHNSVAETVNTQNMGSYYTCQGFDVNVEGLATGTWNIKISLEGGLTTSQSVDIK